MRKRTRQAATPPNCGEVMRSIIIAGLLMSSASLASAAPELSLHGDGQAAEVQIRADDSVRAVQSGFVYPPALGEMPIRKAAVYGPGDVSAYYTRYGGGNGDPFITVFVYPKPMAFGPLVEDVEGAMLSKITDARAIAPPGPLPEGARDGVQKWYSGRYEGLENATNGFIMVERGEWIIKVRATIPTVPTPEKIRVLLTALSAIDWNWGRANAQDEQAQAAP